MLLTPYVQSATPCVAVNTHEEGRFTKAVLEAFSKKPQILAISATGGLRDIKQKQAAVVDAQCTYAKSFAQAAAKNDVILLVFDVQHVLQNAPVYRALKDNMAGLKSKGSIVVLVAPDWRLPEELRYDVPVLEWSLPDRAALKSALSAVANSTQQKVSPEQEPLLLDAAAGLALEQAENAFSLAYVDRGVIDPERVAEEKMRLVRSGGLLEVWKPVQANSVGGLSAFKDYLNEEVVSYKDDEQLRVRGLLFIGVPGCVADDTVVSYNRGARTSLRTLSINVFHDKFNSVGKYGGPQWQDLPTYLQSFDAETGRVFLNKVKGVYAKGRKRCVRLTTAAAGSVTLTYDHPVLTEQAVFEPAGSVQVGDRLLARGSMLPRKQEAEPGPRRERVTVEGLKYHPHGWAHPVTDQTSGKVYTYQRTHRARLVIEAHMNGLSYDEFVRVLKEEPAKAETLRYLDPELEVHHIDEDSLNDQLGNLMMLTKADHTRLHCDESRFNREYTVVAEVVRVEDMGDRETYDVEMELPYANFVVNDGIIVHNTGKSLSMKACGAVLGWPVLRMDVAALKGSLVGQSEGNMRKALKTASAVAPCILGLDELEKGVGGYASSAVTDSGVTLGMLGTLLTWMQENTTPVLTVATCNDFSKLPAELVRRFDSSWFMDLPRPGERREIAEIHLLGIKCPYNGQLLDRVVEITHGYTGDEIRHLIRSGARRSRRKPTAELLAEIGATVKPISVSRAEEVDRLRAWANASIRIANSPELVPLAARRLRRNAPAGDGGE